MIRRLCIIGVGLIGGSLARALRANRSVQEVVGYGRSTANLTEAVRLGVIDGAEPSIAAAVRNSDMIVLAVPVGAMREALESAAAGLAPDAVVTDVGSTKCSVIDDARAALGRRFADFVPAHPIAGRERSGVGASTADLFVGRRVIVTPETETATEATARVRDMWTRVGAHVSTMSAAEHDRVLAASSHVPHALAYALVDMIVRMDEHREVFDCAGGGFRDFTRIAASDPTMWRDIFLANRKEVLVLLRRYQDDLGEMAEAIANGDGRWLSETMTRAKHAREQLTSGNGGGD